MEFDILQRLAVALAIGLLIGLERGWGEREAPEGARIAGIRTFGLIAVLGALFELLASESHPVILALGFAGFAVLMTAATWIANRATQSFGITTEVAAFVTFALGAVAMHGYLVVAASAAVVTTIILSVKPLLHRWLQLLQREELYAILKMLVVSVVVLPVLPNRGYGPGEALNPYAIWWIVVLVCALSFAGYFAQRIAGASRGVMLTSLFGGMVSSTATTLSFSRHARAEPALARLYAVGIVIACATMFVRMLVVVGAVRAELLRTLGWPLGTMAAMAALLAVWQWRRLGRPSAVSPPLLQNPFELKPAVQFAALLTLIMVLAEVLRRMYGNAGIYLLAGLGGISDVDAVTVSLSRMVPAALDTQVATAGITVAAIVNTLVKAILAAAVGGGAMSRRVVLTNLIVACGGIAALWLMR